MVKPDGNGALPPTLPTVPLPGDPTRTAHSTAASTAQPTITPTQLRGPERYQIIGEHGRGGLGKVSRAHDRELGRDVAIKELISRTAVSEVRFLREAMITARLEHPGIVPVHEAGRRADGTPYYAMKLVSGRPLRDLIVERTTVDQRIGLLHHVIAVADAIAYAHGRNIIHRDLKPSNVIVGDFGETIVIDWGLAKDLSASDEARFAAGSARSPQDSDLTAAGAVLGTPTYMAPEQERGEHVDQRADVFAIGAMLWELCSLQKVPPPNLRQRLRLLRRAGIDQDLAVIIDKALDNDPARRYPDAGAVAADLKAFKSGARISARSYSLFAMLAHWTRRHFALAISVLVALVIAILVGSIQYRTVLKVRVAEQIAEARATEAEVEQGRQALLHDESTEALTHLAAAYQRGDRTASVEFMLARALQPRLAERARFTSTAGRIWSATFSPDGRRIVTTDDATAQVWDAQTSRILFTLGHGDIVYHVVCSTDGRMATAGADGIVRIWSLANGTLLRALQWHDGKRFSYFKVAMSTDSHFVAAIDNLGKVAHVWETDTGAPIAELRNDGFENPSLAFSTDGRWLVTSGGDDVRVFDTATWKMVRTLPASRVLSLSFDPTGPRIVTGTASGDASIWAIPTGNRLRHLREIGEPIDRVAFSPNGEFVATASRDSAEQVWRTGSGTLQSQGKYHRGRIFSLEFDSSSTLVLSAGESGTVVVSDAALALPVAVLDGPRAVVREAHFDPSSRRVVAASWDGTARVWDATSPYRRWNSPPVGDDCDTVESLVPDGRYIALSCRDHGTRVWDTARDQLLAELPSVTAIDGDYYSAFPAVSATGDRAAIARGNTVAIYELPGARLLRTITHSAAVNAVAFARTGHDLVSGAIDGSLLVVHDDHDTIALAASAGGIDAVEFLPNGRVVVTDALRRLRVYDPDRNVVLADVEVPARVRSMRSSDDARRLLTIPVRKKPAPPVLWDLESYRIVARLDGHHGRVFSARFVAQGTQILSAANDGTVRLWDGMTGTLRQTYRGTSRFLFDAAMNADGTVIVGGDNEGYLRFWEAASGRPLWALKAHKSYVVGIHFESNEIVTRGFDGSISRWMLPPSKSVIEACLSSETASLDQPCTIMLR